MYWNWINHYKSSTKKLTTADEAVKVVKSGDKLFIGEFVQVPEALEAALAKRVDELENVQLRATTYSKPLKLSQQILLELNLFMMTGILAA